MEYARSTTTKKLMPPLFCALLAAIAIYPFLLDFTFYTDWINNIWIVNYMEKYFANHFYLPQVFNTEKVVGDATPFFYSIYLYPLLTVASFLSNARIALIIAIFLTVFTTLLLNYLFLRKRFGMWPALFLSGASSVSVYQLTNLYQRGALPEFFANQLLLVGVFAASLLFTVKIGERTRNLALVALGLFVACILISHPPSLLLCATAAPFLAPLLTPPEWKGIFAKRHLPYHISFLGLTVLFALPLLISTLGYTKGLRISTDELIFYVGIDGLINRLNPWPTDSRTYTMAFDMIQTPNLHTLIAWPLYAFGVLYFFLSDSRKTPFDYAISIWAAVLTAVITLISIGEIPLGPFAFLAKIQLGYRMVNTANIVMHLYFIWVLARFAAPTGKKWKQLLVGAAVFCALMAVSYTGKYLATNAQSARYAETKPFWTSAQIPAVLKNPNQLPTTYYSHPGYAFADSGMEVAKISPAVSKDLPFHVDPKTLEVTQTSGVVSIGLETLVYTNISSNQFNKLKVIDIDRNAEVRRAVTGQHFLITLDLLPGRYQLTYSIDKPGYTVLRHVLIACFLAIAAFSACWLGLALTKVAKSDRWI